MKENYYHDIFFKYKYDMNKTWGIIPKYSSLLPYHKFPQIWNDLQPEIREIQNTATFKHKLKSCLLGKYE